MRRENLPIERSSLSGAGFSPAPVNPRLRGNIMNMQQRFELRTVSLLVKNGFSRTQRNSDSIVGSTHEGELSDISPEVIRKYDAKVLALSRSLRRTVALVYDPIRIIFSAHVPLIIKKAASIRNRSWCRAGGTG
jgi:hypothetical protein